MSVQVRRRRESAAFLQTFVGAQGELLVDTTNNRVQVHDGVTPGGFPAAKLADVAQRTGVADANYAAQPGDRTIAFTALSASRTVTLPAAAAFPTGQQLLVVDETGACSPTLTVTMARAGADTINGAASAAIGSPYGFLALTSNGKSAWTLVDFAGATTQQLTNRNRIINGNFAVNQRGYASGGTLASSAYAHDRWRDNSSGAWKYTFTQGAPDTLITITAGAGAQVIEPGNVEGGSYMLSWSGTAPMSVTFTNAAGATSVSGTASPLAVTGVVAGTQIIVATTGTGTLGLVQLEAGTIVTKFERRQPAQELQLCQRYFQTNGVLSGFAQSVSSGTFYFVPRTTMRAAPTVALISASVYVESPPGQQGFSTSNASLVGGGYNGLDGTSFTIGGFSGMPSGNYLPAILPNKCVTFSAEL